MKSDRELLEENNKMLRAIINYIVMREQGKINSGEDMGDFIRNILANLASSTIVTD